MPNRTRLRNAGIFMTTEESFLPEWVTLSITGPDQTVQKIEKAKYVYKNGFHYFLYRESLEGHENPFSSRIKIKNGYMELHRGGQVTMNLTFEEQKSHRAQYVAPYGVMTMDINTRKVELQKVGTRLRVNAMYTLTMNETTLEETHWSMVAEPIT